MWTGLVFVNASDNINPIRKIYRDASGTVLARVQRDLLPRQKEVRCSWRLDENIRRTAKSVAVHGEKELVGFMSTGDRVRQNIAGFPVSLETGSSLGFLLDSDTALALLNTIDKPQDLAHQLFDSTGNLVNEGSIKAMGSGATLILNQQNRPQLLVGAWIQIQAEMLAWSGWAIRQTLDGLMSATCGFRTQQ